MITSQQRQIIDATLPAVDACAVKITSCFYPLMFLRYPQVIEFFNQTNQKKGSQRLALASAVVAYAKHLDKLEDISDTVRLITQKHCSLGILPEHYPIVGECLLAAIAQVLGEAASEEVLAAWGAAYQQLADILMGSEDDIYQHLAQRQGGWNGQRTFELIEKRIESDAITSFVLKPAGLEEQIDFIPGQYITIVVTLDGHILRRNYSLSDAPGKSTLQISVKREEGGIISNYLHNQLKLGETVKLTAPCGDFTLADNTKPIVLVTAGVGITPALSMVNAILTAKTAKRDIHFIHCARNGASHAFAHHISQLSQQHDQLAATYIYSHPSPEDLTGDTGHAHEFGFLNKSHVQQHLNGNCDVEFYVLGPKPFMQAALQLASDLGIPESQTHYEFFGPKEDICISKTQQEVAA